MQGVGFRPFVYQLAIALNLRGWVSNSAQGVDIEVQGTADRLQEFVQRLQTESPPHAWIQHLAVRALADADPTTIAADFTIRPSQSGPKTALILPDLATCPACLRELFDPHDRRYRYPFINCTHCGPRFSIIAGLPYDRAQTTMRAFTQCPQCQAEYDNPHDRRFHAQPNACPTCGPQLAWWDRTGTVLAHGEAALQAAVTAIQQGAIVAIKGLGGFHLVVAAQQATAVQQLRQRKQRPDKPFALMYPSLVAVQRDCQVSPLEARLLESPAAPIVLMRRREKNDHPRAEDPVWQWGDGQDTAPDPPAPDQMPPIAPGVAPGNPYLGIMLPYTPLHHLLLAELQRPIVATSGNRSSEPICFDEHEAVARLGELADYFLVHNRPILRPVDDAIVRVVADRALMLRRARGYAPLPLPLLGKTVGAVTAETAIPQAAIEAVTVGAVTAETAIPQATIGLALGADRKNTVALALGSQVFLSQHLGDLQNVATLTSQQQAIATLTQLYDTQPAWIACDLHPDYVSTQVAQQLAQPQQRLIQVQHHHAHIAGCLAENHLTGPVLGVAWDGTGYGPDGTIWGGEFLIADHATYQRVGYLRPFGLPGGEIAVREPRRSAIGLLYEVWGDALFTDDTAQSLAPLRTFTHRERTILCQMLRNQINTPRTSSVGRLFDAIAAIVDLCQTATFEGQAGMAVEFAAMMMAGHGGERGNSTFNIQDSSVNGLVEQGQAKLRGLGAPTMPAETIPPLWVVDWEPWLREVLADWQSGQLGGASTPLIAARLHAALIAAIVAVAERVGIEAVVLSGGCFQNRVLTEGAIAALRQAGFRPYWHQWIPPNDGGIAWGQAVISMAQPVP